MFGWLDFNPVLALDRWLAMLRWGRGVLFVVPASIIQPTLATLKQYGVRTYAYRPPHSRPNERGFRVRAEQAQWAEYLLRRAGVPLIEGPNHPANRVVARGPLPPAWGVPARSVGFAGMIMDFFQRF